MFGQIFKNLPVVTKNILLINVIVYLIEMVLPNSTVNQFTLHHPRSALFEPYQIITHFFMHAKGVPFHLIGNMIGLLVFGPRLEYVWGPKKFFIFYIVCALGASAIYLGYQSFVFNKIDLLINEFIATGDINLYGTFFKTYVPNFEAYLTANNQIDLYNSILYKLNAGLPSGTTEGLNLINEYYFAGNAYYPGIVNIAMLGASGAVYGILLGFALYWPNTELMLLFPPIPIKAKWLVLALAAMALYGGMSSNPNDNVAHFAHLGGMIFAFILIKIWKKDRQSFY